MGESPKTSSLRASTTSPPDPRRGADDGYGPDPHLHTHVVIANMTRRPDGAWRGLDPIEIYRSQTFASAVYRSELAHAVAKPRLWDQRHRSGRPMGTSGLHQRAGDGVLAPAPGHRGRALAAGAERCRCGAKHRASEQALERSPRRKRASRGMASQSPRIRNRRSSASTRRLSQRREPKWRTRFVSPSLTTPSAKR